jgi:hypothetical protein
MATKTAGCLCAGTRPAILAGLARPSKRLVKGCQAVVKHYVYALVDPRTDVVFYIGKGTGRRMFQHELDTKRGKGVNAAKTEVIHGILGAGLSVVCQKLGEFENEAAAYEAEKSETAARVGLTNANLGGGGAWCGSAGEGVRVASPESAARQAKSVLSRLIPYVDWMAIRPRSLVEQSLRSYIVAQLLEIADTYGPPRAGSSRRGTVLA